MDNHLLDNRTMKKLNGNHYLILMMLHIYEEGLSLDKLKHSITSRKTGIPCFINRTLNKVLHDLVIKRYISDNNGLYKLIDIKNYGMGYTKYDYSAIIQRINKTITASQHIIYLALIRNLQQDKDVTYNTLGNDLDIDFQNIGRCIRALEKSDILKIEKVYTEKGIFANKYVLQVSGKEHNSICIECGNEYDIQSSKGSRFICNECFEYHFEGGFKNECESKYKTNSLRAANKTKAFPYNRQGGKGKSGYVYFIQSHGKTKIGQTKSLEDRFEQIKTANIDAEMRFAIRTGDAIYFEKCLHEKFAEKHISREWFMLSDNDLIEIKQKYKKDIVYLEAI